MYIVSENGYEYLHFHVAGKEKMNRNKLEELRALVSRVLCVPSEFIVVTDIEATNSILITFMIPEGYSNIILELNDKDKEYLGSKGVDAVLCNGETINCMGKHTSIVAYMIKDKIVDYPFCNIYRMK